MPSFSLRRQPLMHFLEHLNFAWVSCAGPEVSHICNDSGEGSQSTDICWPPHADSWVCATQVRLAEGGRHGELGRAA